MNSWQPIKPFFKKIFVRMLFAGLLLPPAVILTYKTYVSSRLVVTEHFSPEQITFDIAHFYSNELKQKLVAFISKHSTKKSLLDRDQHAFYRDLKHNFKNIKSCSWEFRMPKTLHLKIEGAQPFCTINHRFVLGNKRRLFPYELFKECDFAALPNLTIDQALCKEKLDKKVYQFVTNIPKGSFAQFNLLYKKPTHIELEPKQSIYKYVVIADEQNFYCDEKLKSIDCILNDLQKRGLLSKRVKEATKPLLAFDLRFEEGVIVRLFDQNKKGGGK